MLSVLRCASTSLRPLMHGSRCYKKTRGGVSNVNIVAFINKACRKLLKSGSRGVGCVIAVELSEAFRQVVCFPTETNLERFPPRNKRKMSQWVAEPFLLLLFLCSSFPLRMSVTSCIYRRQVSFLLFFPCTITFHMFDTQRFAKNIPPQLQSRESSKKKKQGRGKNWPKKNSFFPPFEESSNRTAKLGGRTKKIN